MSFQLVFVYLFYLFIYLFISSFRLFLLTNFLFGNKKLVVVKIPYKVLYFYVTNILLGFPVTLHPKVNVQIVFTGLYWHHFRDLVNTQCNFALVIIS